MRTLMLAGALALMTGYNCRAQDLDLHPIRSVSIDDLDFSDLEALGHDIGAARMVLMGEQSHGDGQTFAAKSRVIRYLHERHGFDVLVFESGLGGLSLAQTAIDEGAAPSRTLRAAVLPVWSESDQVAPLLTYLDNVAASAPMTFAGFDMQETGHFAELMASKLASLPLRNANSAAAAARIAADLAAMNEHGPQGLADLDLERLERDRSLVLEGLTDPSLAEGPVWSQRVESLAAFLIFMRQMLSGPTPQIFNSRDQQMASNLEWLAKVRYPERKIIVWGATSHLIKNRAAIDPSTDEAHEMVPAGALLQKSLGDAAYVLAFTSGYGSVGSRLTGAATDIGEADPDTLEGEALRSDLPYAFSALTSSRQTSTSWMLGYQPMKAEWDRVVDGVFFIREMIPATYAAPPYEVR